MAYPPRAPLVVLPEASGFPGEFAAPWTANREEEDATAAATGTSGDPRGRVSVSGSRSVPTRALPRPVVPCASETATASPSGAARDVDSEVGAHPDTLRSLSLMHGDLVTITERVGGETRVGTIVAATRWLRPGESLDGFADSKLESAREEANGVSDDHDDRRDELQVRPGFLYLPPALRRNLRLHVHFAAASAAATVDAAGRAERDDDASKERRTESTVCAVTVTVARIAKTALRRCASITIAPARIPKPAVPGTTPSFATPSEENALAALEAAAAEHFRRADRLLAVGDVFAATSVVPLDAVAAMASRAENETGPLPRTKRVALHFVVTAADPEEPREEDTESLGVTGDSPVRAPAPSLLVSADRSKCAMVAAVAAGAPSAREAEMFSGLDDGRGALRSGCLGLGSRDPGFGPASLLWRDGGGASLAALVAALAPAAHPATARAFRLTSVAAALTGPRGVGKRSVARAAAEALQLACVEVNCHELLADAGGGGAHERTAVALEAAFDAASAVGPALLYLRRFDALCAAPAGDGPGSGGAPGSRLARALRKCVAGYAYANVAKKRQGGKRREADDDHVSDRGFARGDDDDGDGDDDGEGDGDGGGASSSASSSAAGRSFNDPFPRAGPVLLVAGVDDAASLPEAVRARFTHDVRVRAPGEQWRVEALREALLPGSASGGGTGATAREETRALLETAAAATSGATPRDIRALASRVGAEAFAARSQLASSGLGAADRGSLKPSLDAALKWSEGRVNAAFGAPAVPSTTWDDVGGLEEVKAAIRDVVERPLRRAAEARAANTDTSFVASEGSAPAPPSRRLGGRSGALLYGPPGTGKTLLAKAVATECALRFLSVKGPELVNMYVGESEKNVREVFSRARGAAPCVVFFDELDALAPARGKANDGGGVMDRVVSQLVSELDECVARGDGAPDPRTMVFAVGATNRPDLIDPALLRPGRFDKLLYVGIDVSVEGRTRVLAAMTKRFTFRAPEMLATQTETLATETETLERSSLLANVARAIPETFTGADIYALCADAWMRAAKRAVEERFGRTDANDAEDEKAPDVFVAVEPADFASALEALTPSLTDEEVARYARMRADFEGSRGAAAKE